MKRLAFILLLTGAAVAQPTGFSPTMPFGIPASARTSVSPVNTGGPKQPFHYNPYGYYYYFGGGGGGLSGYTNSGVPASTYGGTLPGYSQTYPSRDLPSYTNNSKPKNDKLPGY